MEWYIELGWIILIGMVLLAFICEFFDSSLGMGYGTTLTPVLLVMGFSPAQIVPAVLISEFFTGIISAAFHTLFKNMTLGVKKPISRTQTLDQNFPSYDNSILDLKNSGGDTVEIQKQSLIGKLRELTIDSKVVLILIGFGIIGTLVSAILSAYFGFMNNASFKFGVKIYIGIMVLMMGVLILAFIKKEAKFSLKRIIFIGGLAGFNKGLSGGGYGPLTVSGQILSGREGKNAIASTSLSEGVICFVGASAYIITNVIMSHKDGGPITVGPIGLFPYLTIGAILSTPLAAFTTKIVKNNWLKIIVGVLTVALGIYSLTDSSLRFTGVL